MFFLLLVVLVCFSNGQIIVPPAVTQPASANDVIGFNLQNPTGNSLSSQYITFGLHFPKGRLSNCGTCVLTATSGTNNYAVQVSVKATHSDGSARHAVLVMLQPSLTANQVVQLMLTKTPSTAGNTISLANFPANTVAVVVDNSPNFSTATFAISQLLATSLQQNSLSYWVQGPLMTQARIQALVSGAMRMVFDISLFVDGSFSVDVQYNNDLAFDTGSTVTYTTTITNGGNTVYQSSSITHYILTDWHYQVFSAGSPQVNIQHDVRALIMANVIPPYNITNGVSQSLLSNLQSQLDAYTFAPMNGFGVLPYMPTTGT